MYKFTLYIPRLLLKFWKIERTIFPLHIKHGEEYVLFCSKLLDHCRSSPSFWGRHFSKRSSLSQRFACSRHHFTHCFLSVKIDTGRMVREDIRFKEHPPVHNTQRLYRLQNLLDKSHIWVFSVVQTILSGGLFVHRYFRWAFLYVLLCTISGMCSLAVERLPLHEGPA